MCVSIIERKGSSYELQAAYLGSLGLLFLVFLPRASKLDCVYRTHRLAISTIRAIDFARPRLGEAGLSASVAIIALGGLEVFEQRDAA